MAKERRLDEHEILWYRVLETKGPTLPPYICKARVGTVADDYKGGISCCGKVSKNTCLVEEHAPWLRIEQQMR